MISIRFFWGILFFFGLSISTLFSATVGLSTDSLLIRKYQNLLTRKTVGVGLPIENRKGWNAVVSTHQGLEIIQIANKLIEHPFPEWNDSIYQTYYRTGERLASDRLIMARREWLPKLVLAECVENKGRFLPHIEHVITDLCRQPTWTLAAHDWHMENYKGRYGVDLSAATLANQMGQTLYLLGGRLSKKVQLLARKTLDERIYTPVRNSFIEKNGQHWWLTGHNNWNAVCVAGVVATALASEPDLDRRAYFAALAETQIRYFLAGFDDDGYCMEGLGYYSYGFSYFLLLREAMYRATGGKVDLLSDPKVRKIANYPLLTEIQNGVYPAISDCRMGSKPAEWILYYCNRNLKWGFNSFSSVPRIEQVDLVADLLLLFGDSPLAMSVDNQSTLGDPLRSFYPKIGMLICRPFDSTVKEQSMSVAIVGGNNGQSHNHNDLGTYSLVVDDELIMGDMGGPNAYTSKTFGKERYSLYKSFSSIGHPVPLIDGVEQHESTQAAGTIVYTQFSDSLDRITYDLRSGYRCDQLMRLTRDMSYSRSNNVSLVVVDDFESSEPITFETALTTRASIRVEKDRIYLSANGKSVEIEVKSSLPYLITQTTLEDYAMIPFSRIGIVQKDRSKVGSIALKYRVIENRLIP